MLEYCSDRSLIRLNVRTYVGHYDIVGMLLLERVLRVLPLFTHIFSIPRVGCVTNIPDRPQLLRELSLPANSTDTDLKRAYKLYLRQKCPPWWRLAVTRQHSGWETMPITVANLQKKMLAIMDKSSVPRQLRSYLDVATMTIHCVS